MTVKMKEDDVCEGLVKGRADTALKILPVSVLGAWTPVLVLPHFYLRPRQSASRSPWARWLGLSGPRGAL